MAASKSHAMKAHASSFCEKLNLALTMIFGLICISPLFADKIGDRYETDDEIFDRSISPLIYYSPSVIASVFVVIIPATDLLIDLLTNAYLYYFPNESSRKKPDNGTEVSRLTDLERLIFILGVAVQSAIWFLPPDTSVATRSIVATCTENLSAIFVLNPVAIFLLRCTSTFTDYFVTVLVVLGGFGVSLISFSNFFRNDRATLIRISIAGISLANVAAALYVCLMITCLFKYCRNYFGTRLKRQLNFSAIVAQFGPKTLSKDEKNRVQYDYELYKNYIPALHMISSLVILTATAVTGAVSGKETYAIEKKNYIVLIAEVVVLVIELRIRKNEIARGLIDLLQSKKSYVRYISHELRTPLNTAFLGLKLLTLELKASNDPKDVEHYDTLCDVNVSCMAAVDILNDLLCFEKLESGILDLHREHIMIERFLLDSMSMFAAQARECNVAVSLLLDTRDIDDLSQVHGVDLATLPIRPRDSVYADKFKMDQVIRNLISNALKFTPRGGTVTIRAAFVHEINQQLQGTERYTGGGNTFDSLDLSLDDEWGFSTILASEGASTIVPSGGSPQILNGRLIIVVTDTGAGISSANQARLFKEIIQFNPEKLQAGGGSGLGLWITKGIVDLHQGNISVFSSGENKGSAFTVEIPMIRVSHVPVSEMVLTPPPTGPCPSLASASDLSPDTDITTDSTNTPGTAPKYPTAIDVPLRGPRGINRATSHSVSCYEREEDEILVVDDSRLNRKMLMKCLKAEGYACVEASDGLEALAAVKKKFNVDNGGSGKPFAAILMDFVMPIMDGPTATREIRALGYTAPIYGVTGNGLPADVDHFIEAGADRILLKPLDMTVLIEAMRGKRM